MVATRGFPANWGGATWRSSPPSMKLPAQASALPSRKSPCDKHPGDHAADHRVQRQDQQALVEVRDVRIGRLPDNVVMVIGSQRLQVAAPAPVRGDERAA